MITHVVQAFYVDRWFDARIATSMEEAKEQEARLKAKDGAWMSDDVERRTRIVEVQMSNCPDLYNRINH